MIDTEIEFYIRDRDNIDEFLYEIDSSFVRVESGKMFDSVDLIFFEGDANLRPWSPNAYKVCDADSNSVCDPIENVHEEQ